MSPVIPHLYACVLAGGSGQRFWPLSRELSPKQLLSMFGTESLIAQAVHRITPLTQGGESVLVVTNERLFDELRNHLTAQPDPELHRVRYLKEPMARNTAPAIALAAATLAAEDPDAVMVVLPSDHLLEDGDLWRECIESGVKLANGGYLVTIGIRPSRPETGYGYIKAAEPLEAFAVGEAMPFRAERFVEKPDAQRAKEYVDSGAYFWNAGIFVMRADQLLEELATRQRRRRAHRRAPSAPSPGCRPRSARGRRRSRCSAHCRRSRSTTRSWSSRRTWPSSPPASSGATSVRCSRFEAVAPTDGNGNVRVGRGVDVDTSRFGHLLRATDWSRRSASRTCWSWTRPMRPSCCRRTVRRTFVRCSTP